MTDTPLNSAPAPSRSMPDSLWYALAAVMLILTLCSCVYTTVLIVNPQHPLNPFPPPTSTPFPTAVIPTLTPTWTASPTASPEQTAGITIEISNPSTATGTTSPTNQTPIGTATRTPAAPSATSTGRSAYPPPTSPVTPTADFTPIGYIPPPSATPQ